MKSSFKVTELFTKYFIFNRYEGLRSMDLRRVITQLKQDYSRQVGPRPVRPACRLFRSWIDMSVDMPEVAGENDEEEESSSGETSGSAGSAIDKESLAASILPLPLFQPTDKKQFVQLYQLSRRLPQLLHYYLCQHIFPATMNFQEVIVSIYGHKICLFICLTPCCLSFSYRFRRVSVSELIYLNTDKNQRLWT